MCVVKQPTLSLNWFLVSALHSRMPSRMAFRCTVTTGTGSRIATTCQSASKASACSFAWLLYHIAAMPNYSQGISDRGNVVVWVGFNCKLRVGRSMCDRHAGTDDVGT